MSKKRKNQYIGTRGLPFWYANRPFIPGDYTHDLFSNQKGAPYLDAYIGACGSAYIWCKYCDDWHHHGAYNGHRVAHCGRPQWDTNTGKWYESPYYETGYNLRIVGPLTREVQLRAERRRGPLSPKLRFAILKRDGYRCQICGRAAQDGIKLVIDHKVAWANGGTDDEENLWTLCDECNAGKSNEYL